MHHTVTFWEWTDVLWSKWEFVASDQYLKFCFCHKIRNVEVRLAAYQQIVNLVAIFFKVPEHVLTKSDSFLIITWIKKLYDLHFVTVKTENQE